MIDARVRDVTRELNANSIDAPELRSALATLYGMSSIPEPYVVEYSGTDAMRVFYSGEAVVKVTVARSTNDDRVEEIREHIENALGVPGQESVATAILFSYGSRVTGYWRYGQQALIAPIPDGAPTAGMEAADHPFLVQFAYPESPHHLVRGLRTRYRSRELELLLNVFLMAQIRRLSQSPSHSWVFRPRE